MENDKVEKDLWGDRGDKMHCRSCQFFVRKQGLNLAIGRCRRRAPTLNGYPVVFSLDWCGDHKLDENAE